MNYFQNCNSAEEIKKTYRTLSMKFHPDQGGDEQTMKEINRQLDEALRSVLDSAFDTWKERTQSTGHYQYSEDKFSEILRNIVDFNIRIEIIGFWIYAFESYQYKNALKELGFWFSKKHKAWVYSGDKKRKVRSKLTTNDVRTIHGSREIRDREKVLAITG